MRTHRLATIVAFALTTACGVKEKIEQRVAEEVAEKVVEVAANGEIDVETRDGRLTIEGQDGHRIEVDPDAGTTRVVDEQGKTWDYAQAADGSAKLEGSDGTRTEVGKEIPADFPIALPPVEEVTMAASGVNPDRSRTWTVDLVLVETEIDPVEKAMTAAFEGKGLTVERISVETLSDTRVTLTAMSADAKLAALATLNRARGNPNVILMVSWLDKTDVPG